MCVVCCETSSFGPSVIVKRSDFIQMLYDHTAKNIPVLMSTTITKLEQSTEHVEVTVCQ
jgi:2-polyprenyl-6-methoxyphenol hydroxylase-like FAD-dependent oxidoreductase